ncbi:S8 family serine peptidase [Actinotalea ferrariae]|uniref:S8 family serine peptidase n=1 Tax=Actinotalea ferrariae TaxID=1386098 RepID=UPI001C8C7800|nr:S8 family serine peptidase [Actinotalea ferrariae]MBX9245416.1 S8 family serine peptidase [Actinotalea ferrariae]
MRARRTILASLTAAALALPLAGIGAATAAPPAPEPPPPGAAGVPVPQGALPVPTAGGEDGGAQSKVTASMAEASGNVTAFVQLDAPSALDTAEAGGSDAEVAAVEQEVAALAEEVVPQGPSAPESVEVTSNLVSGVVVTGDAEEIRALAAEDAVVRVHLVVTKYPANKGTDVFTRALESWQATGLTGQDVTIGVIDTGVDYTHANFGGPGTVEAYAEAYGADGTGPVPEGLYDPAKFLGGYDFAGATYDPDVPGTAQPDENPIDPPYTSANVGHGSHVAGTAAGYGVLADGTTFEGDYTTLTDISDWKIGPGSAPEAGIYGLKVFGDAGGGTNLTINALEWAADPNGDGDLNDHLDIINLSLGLDYGVADDPENLFIDELSRLGVLSVIASGNAGDNTDIGGSPGNARSALTVAWSVGDTQTFDAVEVVEAGDPALVGLHAAQNSVNYGGEDVTAPVAYIGEVDGCDPFTPEQAAATAGNIVWLWWDDDDATRRCGSGVRWNNATAAGAVGVLIGTELRVFPAGIAGNTEIPGAQLTAAATDALLPEIQAGSVVAHIGPSLGNAAMVTDPTLADTLSTSSSRGVHGSLGVIKPDVAAPGNLIASTASGSGTEVHTISGTSMATPHVAGIAALLVQQHTDWTPAQVKAAVMNTATHDVYRDENGTGPAFGPLSVGSGRVDAFDATQAEVIAYATQDPELVSVTFGVLDVATETVVESRQVTVRNMGSTTKTYGTSFSTSTTAGSATITTTPSSITVAPGDEAVVTLTLTVDPAGLTRDMDPNSDETVLGVPRDFVTSISGRLVLQPSAGPELRVPVQAAPRPVGDISAAGPVEFTDGADTTAELVLEGRAVTTPGWASHVAPFALVAESPQLEDDPSQGATSESSIEAADIRYVGFSSTAPQIAAAGGDPSLGTIGIGIATEGEWPNLGTLAGIPYVQTDIDGDGTADLETAVQKIAAETDLTVATTYWLHDEGDYSEGDVVGVFPVNGVWSDQFTTVFDSDVVVLPIPLTDTGTTEPTVLIAPGDVPTFSVATFSDYASSPTNTVDSVEPFTADPYAPPFWFEGTTPDSLWFEASDGAAITVHRAPTAGDARLLLLHNANVDGRRAEVVDVTAPVATPTTTTLTVNGVLRDGAPIRLDARIAPAEATGTVTFLDGTTEIGSARVRNGLAWTTVRLTTGSHTLQAVFTPDDPRWAGSSSAPVTVEVRAKITSTLIMQAPSQIQAGQTAYAVGLVYTDGARPFGTVEVSENGTVLASATVFTVGRAGLVSVQLPRNLSVGTHHLTFTYTGNDWVAPASVEQDVRVVARGGRWS